MYLSCTRVNEVLLLLQWFILPLLLATPTMQFSLDCKRRSHKQNQCSASNSVDLIFTRSYRCTLPITTPTTTPSLVKTGLRETRKAKATNLSKEILIRRPQTICTQTVWKYTKNSVCWGIKVVCFNEFLVNLGLEGIS